MKNQTKSKNFLKYIVFIPFLCVLALIFAFFSSFFIITRNEKLNNQNLTKAYSSNLTIYSLNGNEINSHKNNSRKEVEISNLNDYTVDAFLSIEDKNFYKHNGINLKRMAGALVANIKKGKIVQGASTISQQLIKNTHLSSEKSISRKLKEIKLTFDLEKKYSKDQILQMYLSSIYFGNGNYGLEAASQSYFNKKSSELTLAESAMLAGIISAPSAYNPLANLNNAISRKNLVLSEMLKDKKISQYEYNNAKSETPKIYNSNTNLLDQYTNACILEACDILQMNENQITNRDYKIYTYKDNALQEKIKKIIENNTGNLSNTSTTSMVTNNNGDILAFYGNTNLDMYSCRRQPGSAIKPILVYTPAIELDNISPATTVLDEPINYEGYSPENANKKYSGNISVRECVKKSLNIPAVKILNSTGIEKSKAIASKMGITFSENDKNLSLALGGFTDGSTLRELTESYLVLQNQGINIKPKFISKITDSNDNILYERNTSKRRVIKESTAALMTDILKDVASSGTASRLDSLSIPIASKTGTVGALNSNKNTDAWNVSYTTKHIIITWVGATNKSSPMPSSVNGSTYPTNITKNIAKYLYKNQKPDDFLLPSSVLKINVDIDAKNKGLLIKTDDLFSSTSELFSESNTPSIIIEKPLKPELSINNFENKKPELRFFAQYGFSYNIYRNNQLLHSICGSGNNISYIDTTSKKGEIYTYTVELKTKNYKVKSNTIKVLCLI